MAVGRDAGTMEAHAHEELFDRFMDRLPKEFTFEREMLRSRLWRSPDRWEPVSYTHLDVYKRQVLMTQFNIRIKLNS